MLTLNKHLSVSEDPGCVIDEAGLDRILKMLYSERGFDFRGYKRSTLLRRMAKRISALGVSGAEEYAQLLRNNPAEYDALICEFTINVTKFFRDEEIFDYLRQKILPGIIKRKSQGNRTIRFWSAGCATGEEAYTLAIILFELLEGSVKDYNISIYGSDIDTESVSRAMKAVYDETVIAAALPPDMKNRYFSPYDGRFKLRQEIRSLVKFTTHDLVTGFTYANFDLIMCRNVLIYFDKKLQRSIIQKFHRGLADNGILVLGKSEVLPRELRDHFHCLYNKAKVYRKRHPTDDD